MHFVSTSRVNYVLHPNFHLLLDGVRGALHPPLLQRGFVLGVHHGSVGHQLQFIVLKTDLKANLQILYVQMQHIKVLAIKAIKMSYKKLYKLVILRKQTSSP